MNAQQQTAWSGCCYLSSNSITETNAQQQTAWSGCRYLSSNSITETNAQQQTAWSGCRYLSSNSITETNAQQQTAWSSCRYLSSHSGWRRPGILSTSPSLITKSFKKCSISNDLDGTEDDVLWAEQQDKSDTDSEEKGNNMYDGMMTHEQIQQMFSEEKEDGFFGF